MWVFVELILLYLIVFIKNVLYYTFIILRELVKLVIFIWKFTFYWFETKNYTQEHFDHRGRPILSAIEADAPSTHLRHYPAWRIENHRVRTSHAVAYINRRPLRPIWEALWPDFDRGRVSSTEALNHLTSLYARYAELARERAVEQIVEERLSREEP